MPRLHNVRAKTERVAHPAFGKPVKPSRCATVAHLPSNCGSVAPTRAVAHPRHAQTSEAPDECQIRDAVADDPRFAEFCDAAAAHNLVPVYSRITADQLTPVTAYRCLVKEDDREAPSFLFESVQNGTDTGRYSFVGAHPALEILAKGSTVTVLDHDAGERREFDEPDPVSVPVAMSREWNPAQLPHLPDVFTGGWVGFTGYDTVRYTYPSKIPFSAAPADDRGLLDLHLALYKEIVVFDNATKLLYVIAWVDTAGAAPESLEKLYYDALCKINAIEVKLTEKVPSLLPARVTMSLSKPPKPPQKCNMSKEDFLAAVETTKEHIRAGDVFQLVLSQRFERSTFADPFEIYRSLRIVNPSPYMVYLQARSCILVASSPEILCRVDKSRVITNRPLAGTRKRGATDEEDAALEADLLADEKELAEHIMLVDLGRNDVGRVATPGSVKVDSLMDIERYSHVMHISSTVTGELKPELDCWDALRAALPVGTISGAPKVRAMQIIDELEVNQRGPYGGGFGHVSFTGRMDMALALRTMVIPTNSDKALQDYSDGKPRREWSVHIQAGAGLVADSVPESEYQETVNKSNALSRAIDLAEESFLGRS